LSISPLTSNRLCFAVLDCGRRRGGGICNKQKLITKLNDTEYFYKMHNAQKTDEWTGQLTAW